MWAELWVKFDGKIRPKSLILMVGAAGFEPATSTV